MRPRWIAIAVILFPLPAAAQTPTGYVSVFLDRLPNRDAIELRARGFAEEKVDAGPHVRLTASGFVEGLLADRRGRTTDTVAEPQELSVQFRAKRVDVTAGLGRVVWGRLDELQPTDVVNPLDLSRFFFEGRSEARLSIPLVRAQVFAGDKVSVEGVYVPVFRRGRFDRLDERTSPFNIEPGAASCLGLGCPAPVFVRREPARTFANAQGGARVNVTSGRVDWSVSTYRGFRPFGIYTLSLPIQSTVDNRQSDNRQSVNRQSTLDNRQSSSALTIEYPRFTMIGGDFETVAGPWVVRGEAAAFTRDAFQAPAALSALTGRSFDAGVGVDRKAGDYRVSGDVLVHRERYDPSGGRTDVSLIVSLDRSFARQKYQGRLFGVYNPNGSAGFVRGIVTATLRDNMALEGSLGWFAGSGFDTISRFADSDFMYLRLKYFF